MTDDDFRRLEGKVDKLSDVVKSPPLHPLDQPEEHALQFFLAGLAVGVATVQNVQFRAEPLAGFQMLQPAAFDRGALRSHGCPSLTRWSVCAGAPSGSSC